MTKIAQTNTTIALTQSSRQTRVMGMNLTIVVADDHEVVRRGVKALLETQGEWRIVGEAVNGQEAIQKTIELHPDVIVLDINLPDLDGLEAGRRIREVAPQTEVLILTYYDSPLMVRKALESGIHGYVLKSEAGRELLDGVTAVGQHKVFLSSKVSPELPGGELVTGVSNPN